MNPTADQAPAVSLHAITKRFPGVLANDDISLAFHAGEVHALLGENGAGKSTLIGILSGMQQPDAGHIEIDGARVKIHSPRESLRLRIGTVFQHVLLVNSLTVIENLMLGGAWWRVNDRKAALAEVPYGDMATPDELGQLTAFLLSGACKSATGATFDVNGASYVR